ncbi:metallophosphoesterase family protein [Lapidilactobacillus bayanensis]|uniref:metallophosphoesterase family protein n=1 Tax=Lapidilactobacillus bayanensis TaxID=2485998 RepID=UPI000F7B3267|nr:metallophosphoesterase [Lapidilactobacillus bayanensis]
MNKLTNFLKKHWTKQLAQQKKPGVYTVPLINDNGKKVSYSLIVTPERQQLLLPQQKADGLTGPLYFRSYSTYFKRYNALTEIPLGPRQFVKQYLQDFSEKISPKLTPASLTLGVVTDTHDKADVNYTYYGSNGLQHIAELNLLDQTGLLDFKGHLGDAIDGSDTGSISQAHLGKIVAILNQDKTPFFMAKGNHDENDKYDEKLFQQHPSFQANTYGNLVYKKLFAQPQINHLSYQTGLSYFDKGHVRVISINTSDVPYLIAANGLKKYDVKLTLAIRQQQIAELITILQQSQTKQIVILGHANLLKADGGDGLQYNGHAVHELLVAFNRHLKGRLQPRQTNPDFAVDLPFDFSQNKSGQIWAYICGHLHTENAYQINGIQYVLLNCSALMGRDHALTTTYNRAWNRRQGTLTEFAGYVIDINAQTRQLQVFGYGAASPERSFQF